MIWLILILGLALRLISINQSLWLDEGIEAWAVDHFSYHDLVTSYPIGDFHPPLYHLFLKFWTQIFGFSEISLRMPSVIFGVLTVYLVYLLGKEIKNKNFGLIVALFLATSGLHIYYSQEARMYSLVTFLVMLSFYFLIREYPAASSAGMTRRRKDDRIRVKETPNLRARGGGHFLVKSIYNTSTIRGAPPLAAGHLGGVLGWVVRRVPPLAAGHLGGVLGWVVRRAPPLAAGHLGGVLGWVVRRAPSLTAGHSWRVFVSRYFKRNHLYLGYFFSTVFFLYTTYLSFLMIFGFLIFLIWERKRLKKGFLKGFILTTFLIVLAFLPWLSVFSKQLIHGQELVMSLPVWKQVVGGSSLKNLLLVFVKFSIGRISVANKIIYGLLLAPIVSFFTFFIIRSFKEKESLLFGSCFFVPLALSFLISFFVPAVSYFRLLFLLPFFYFLVGLGLDSFFTPGESLRATPGVPLSSTYSRAVIFVIIINLTTSLVYLFNPWFHREDWRGLVSYLRKENINNHPVLIIDKVERPFLYYDKGKAKLYYFGKNGDRFKDYDTIWVIPYAEDIFDPEKKQRETLQTLGFKNVLIRHFNGVTLERFEL